MKISEPSSDVGAVLGRALADDGAQVVEAGAQVGDQREQAEQRR